VQAEEAAIAALNSLDHVALNEAIQRQEKANAYETRSYPPLIYLTSTSCYTPLHLFLLLLAFTPCFRAPPALPLFRAKQAKQAAQDARELAAVRCFLLASLIRGLMFRHPRLSCLLRRRKRECGWRRRWTQAT
jgi:hypothetical protein